MPRRRTSRSLRANVLLLPNAEYGYVEPNESVKPVAEFHKEIEDGIRDAMLALLKQPTHGFTYTPAAMDKLSLLYVKIGQRYCDTEALKEKRVFQQMYGFYMMVRDAQNRIIDMLRKGAIK
jgi:hypothetical protein